MMQSLYFSGWGGSIFLISEFDKRLSITKMIKKNKGFLMDRFSCFAFAFLMAVSFSAQADYWSLASFSNEGNGMKGLARIKDNIPNAVLAASGDRYRVVVEKSADAASQKMQLETDGYWPWTVYASQINQIMTDTSTRISVEHYLVAGSFTNERGAQTFMRSLQSDGRNDVEIQMGAVGDAMHYRVVQGPYEERSLADTDLRAYGIDRPWWLTVTKESLVAESMMDSEGAPMEETLSVEVEMDVEKEPVYSITPPSSDESYVMYCLHKANPEERALYCKNDDFNRIATAEAESSGFSSKAALMACALRSRDGTLQDCKK
jgi:hypothetical protein